MKRTFFNPETETTEEYTDVWKYEVMSMKDIKDLLVRTHYWQDKAGELWLDFDDPNENFRIIFTAYRSRKGYMQPQQIKELRGKLGLSLREFSGRLGISYAKLSQIENNKRVQTLSQEVSFRKAQQDYHGQGFLTDYTVVSNSESLLTQALRRASSNKVSATNKPYAFGSFGKSNYFNIMKNIGGAI